MKKTAAFITLTLLLVIFPIIGSGAFADFIDQGSLPIHMLSEPLVMVLFGSALVAFGTSLRKIK